MGLVKVMALGKEADPLLPPRASQALLLVSRRTESGPLSGITGSSLKLKNDRQQTTSVKDHL